MNKDENEPVVVKLRGAAGAVFSFELGHLGEVYKAQLRQGSLRPADSNSAKILAEYGLEVGP